jgi:hypothetical protein
VPGIPGSFCYAEGGISKIATRYKPNKAFNLDPDATVLHYWRPTYWRTGQISLWKLIYGDPLPFDPQKLLKPPSCGTAPKIHWGVRNQLKMLIYCNFSLSTGKPIKEQVIIF